MWLLWTVPPYSYRLTALPRVVIKCDKPTESYHSAVLLRSVEPVCLFSPLVGCICPASFTLINSASAVSSDKPRREESQRWRRLSKEMEDKEIRWILQHRDRNGLIDWCGSAAVWIINQYKLVLIHTLASSEGRCLCFRPGPKTQQI